VAHSRTPHRETTGLARGACPGSLVLLAGDDKQSRFEIDPGGTDDRARLRRLADGENGIRGINKHL
jgi:hypothetical protein